MRSRPLLAVAVALALADASVVALALPPIVADLHASVRQAAAVLGVYALALAVVLWPLVALPARGRPGTLGAAGWALFAVASVGCAVAGSVGALLVARGFQAAGAAAGLVGAFAAMDGAGAGRRIWTAAAIFGTAAGPALGGVLTQAADWRAVFWAQVPIGALAAAVAFATRGRVEGPRGEGSRGRAKGTGVRAHEVAAPAARLAALPLAALGLVSAALVGVLFLLVLMLVTGWSLSPLAAAATVTVLPLSALAGARIPGEPRERACAGAGLLAGGVAALAAVPGASPWWTLVPQAVAGVGMGLALTALAGGLLPERTPRDAAVLLGARHVGIALALALIAPIAAHELDSAVTTTRERGAALVLDAQLPPLEKLGLVGTITGPVDVVDPRGTLRRALARGRSTVGGEPDRQAAYRRLETRADDAVVAGVDGAFRVPLLVCAALAVVAAALLVPPPGYGRRRALAVTAAALALAGAALLVRPQIAPAPVQIADPCKPRRLPHTGGIDGALQDAALAALDRAACRWGSSREELAIALVDKQAAVQYRREHGVDPRNGAGLLVAALGL